MAQRVVRIIRSRKAKVNFLKIRAVVNNKNRQFSLFDDSSLSTFNGPFNVSYLLYDKGLP